MKIKESVLKKIIKEEIQNLSSRFLFEADNEFKSTATKLERYIPLIKKVCSLLPIETFTSIHFVDEDDNHYKTYEDAKNRAYFDVKPMIITSVGNSWTDDESYDLMYFAVEDSEFFGKINLSPFDYGDPFANIDSKEIDLSWLKEQSDFLAFDDMDLDLQDAVNEFIKAGKVELKDNIHIDVDLD